MRTFERDVKKCFTLSAAEFSTAGGAFFGGLLTVGLLPTCCERACIGTEARFQQVAPGFPTGYFALVFPLFWNLYAVFLHGYSCF